MKKIILSILVLGFFVAPIFVFAATFNAELKFGSKGNEVKALQQELIKQGFLKGKPTSYFGNDTKNALIKYQKKNNLKQTGKTDKVTRNKLNKVNEIIKTPPVIKKDNVVQVPIAQPYVVCNGKKWSRCPDGQTLVCPSQGDAQCIADPVLAPIPKTQNPTAKKALDNCMGVKNEYSIYIQKYKLAESQYNSILTGYPKCDYKKLGDDYCFQFFDSGKDAFSARIKNLNTLVDEIPILTFDNQKISLLKQKLYEGVSNLQMAYNSDTLSFKYAAQMHTDYNSNIINQSTASIKEAQKQFLSACSLIDECKVIDQELKKVYDNLLGKDCN